MEEDKVFKVHIWDGAKPTVVQPVEWMQALKIVDDYKEKPIRVVVIDLRTNCVVVQ